MRKKMIPKKRMRLLFRKSDNSGFRSLAIETVEADRVLEDEDLAEYGLILHQHSNC